jgi:NitT/TauT family transport system substrate-binding protein
MNTLRRRMPLFIVSALMIGIIVPASSFTASAADVSCTQPAKAPKDLGTLVVANKADHASALEWGIQAGCYKKYGLTIKNVLVASNPVAAAGLVSNSYDLIVSAPSSLIQLMGNGDFPVRIIAPRFGYTQADLTRAKQDPLYPGEMILEVGLVVKKDSPIRTWKDLQHRKVGLATIQGPTHAGILLAIKASHGDPSSIQIVILPAAQSSAALQRGDVDAVAVSEPYASQAILDGGRLLGYPGAYFYRPSPANVYATSDAILQKRKAAMRAFQKATLEVNHLLNQPENEASFRKIYAKFTGVDDAAAASAKLPVLRERNVSLAELHFLPSLLYQLGFTRTKVDISSLVFIG